MGSKPFEEKQTAKEKETFAGEKPDKAEKPEKDAVDTKLHKDFKDRKDNPDKPKHEKEKHEKEKREKVEKEHKIEKFELKEHLEKPPTTEVFEPATPYVSAGAAPKPSDKLSDKSPAEKPLSDTKVSIKNEGKEHKYEKFEHKDHKFEVKEFIKEHKLEVKEFKIEKLEFETMPGGIDPGGPVEQRLAQLEALVGQLLHFIPENLRPDLSQGALKQEPDAAKNAAPAAAKAGEAKADPQTKKS